MSNINCHKEMTTFHQEKVTLSKGQQDDMRNRRDSGRKRLKNGLEILKGPEPKYFRSQGSYVMRTMVQDDDNDYDIDDGVYFASEDLKDDSDKDLAPKAARELVCNALKWDGRLKMDAIVKRNCVRQEYEAGYHIDIPVYRIVIAGKDEKGEPIERYELASGDEWVKSDAQAVTDWFNDLVGILNAGESDGSQMRRITKLTKKFARRNDWKEETTSGVCITKLVVDNFKSSADRDDRSLQETWTAILNQLQISTEIKHPVLPDALLAPAGDEEVKFFRDCLEDSLKDLQVLDKPNCTRKEAREAWDKVFDTDFFTNQPNNDGDDDGGVDKKVMTGTSGETVRRNGDREFG